MRRLQHAIKVQVIPSLWAVVHRPSNSFFKAQTQQTSGYESQNLFHCDSAVVSFHLVTNYLIPRHILFEYMTDNIAQRKPLKIIQGKEKLKSFKEMS